MTRVIADWCNCAPIEKLCGLDSILDCALALDHAPARSHATRGSPLLETSAPRNTVRWSLEGTQPPACEPPGTAATAPFSGYPHEYPKSWYLLWIRFSGRDPNPQRRNPTACGDSGPFEGFADRSGSCIQQCHSAVLHSAVPLHPLTLLMAENTVIHTH